MPFPHFNMMSFWVTFVGFLVLIAAFFVADGPTLGHVPVQPGRFRIAARRTIIRSFWPSANEWIRGFVKLEG